MAALVTPEALAAHLTAIGHTATPEASREAAETASAYVAAYCTRSLPDPAPSVVRKVALSLAVRLAANPEALRQVSAEGQSVNPAPTGFTFLESVLLNRWRRRAA